MVRYTTIDHQTDMTFYLGLVLGWFGVAIVLALAMGRFIAAGRGALDADNQSARVQSPLADEPRKRGAEVAVFRRRDAA